MVDPALLCDFLSRLFAAPPNADFMLSCREGAGHTLLATLAGDATLRPAVQRMTAALADPDAERAISETHALLFSGLAGPETVSPYASVHLTGRLFGDATARMDGLLTALDMHVATECREPADHLAIQLAALAELLRRDDAITARRFIDEHLANWLPSFIEQCHARNPIGFYAAAATLLDAICSDNCLAPRAEAA